LIIVKKFDQTMLINILVLSALYIAFRWSVAWIKYFNNLDERFGKSIWRWSYDYPVMGKRDISILDDKNFVLLRRKRNRAVTIMYWIALLIFISVNSIMSHILIRIFG
tara:strand:+ start:197 stop:520 length:324 start_codon:yes stop_codon:yes gene_type:complete